MILCAGTVGLVVADRVGRADDGFGELRTVGWHHWRERNVMAAPNIGHSVIRIVNVFVVVILILILLNVLGRPISNAIPSAAQNVRDMLAGLWNGIKDLVPHNWNDYFYHHQ
jgi:hypothetical protein